jgi:hypothetical protein
MHVWAEGSWFDTVRGWCMCRVAAGPFNLTFVQWSSLLDGKTYSKRICCPEWEEGVWRVGDHG